jgi:hypothetical protein
MDAKGHVDGVLTCALHAPNVSVHSMRGALAKFVEGGMQSAKILEFAVIARNSLVITSNDGKF